MKVTAFCINTGVTHKILIVVFVTVVVTVLVVLLYALCTVSLKWLKRMVYILRCTCGVRVSHR